MYQFRFLGNESNISDVFKEPELSKTFEEAFTGNYAILIDRIREYREFILSNTDLNSDSINLSEDKIVSEFEKDLKRLLLRDAIEDVFASKLNVKENLLERLQGSYIKEGIMGRKLLRSFDNIILNSANPTLGISYVLLEELQSKFLQ